LVYRTILTTVLIIGIRIYQSVAQPRFGGFLQLDKRFVIGGDSTYIDDFYNRFRFELKDPISSRLYFVSSLDLRFYDFPNPKSLTDLEQRNSDFPYELSIWEAFIDVYGFLFDNLDLRIGKQRIAWGKADKLNPTDNLNPNDFSDLIHFTDMVPSWAIKGSWYFGEQRLTGVWLPGITPILLPHKGSELFLGDSESFNDALHLPNHTPNNSMFAFQLDGSIDKWDYTLNYFNGFDDIPLPTRLILNHASSTQPEIKMEFPRMQVIGIDLASDLHGVGVWTDAGLFIPKKVELITEINEVVTRRESELRHTPYLKFTLGGDYNFSNGYYLNAQWMHGFYTQRGAGALNDYLVTKIEKKLRNDDLLISFTNSLEIKDWKTMGEGLLPELTYQGIDNFEAGVGAFIVTGTPGTLLQRWEELDQLYVKFRVDF